jgi:spermidine synthase
MISAFGQKTAAYTFIAFISGFSLLAVEITGARLIAGTLGNSIYTWSALIAAILLAMSIGGLVGGLLIDRNVHYKWLVFSLLFAALTTALVPITAGVMAGTVSSMELTEGALFECAMVFALPSLAYGAIPPICVKLLSSDDKGRTVGFSAGIISMAGSLGSFVGALATPFWLVPHLSLTAIFCCLAGAVALSSLLLVRVAPLSKKTAVSIGIFAVGLLVAAAVTRIQPVQAPYLYDQNTPYHRIRVVDTQFEGQNGRYLLLDTTMEGGIVPGTDTLPLEYQNTWQLVKKLGIPVKRVLCIGAGAFGIPERISQTYPDAIIDVAEIDPKVIEAGFRFFDLGKFPNVHPSAADGRMFLARSTGKYDLIFIDAYHGIRYIPPHLTTVEFFTQCRQHLSERGIVMMNVISAISGKDAELFRAFGATIKTVFPDCYVIPMEPLLEIGIQNIVLVCAPNALAQDPQIQQTPLSNYSLVNSKPMWDELNPIEAILARQLRDTPE